MLHQKVRNILFVVVLTLATFIINYLSNSELLTRNVYHFSLQNQFDGTFINYFFDFQARYALVGYFLIPFWVIVKNFAVTLLIQTGLLLNDRKLKFGQTFGIALTADFIFILSQLIKLAWFLLIKTDYTLANVQQFCPLSALNLFDVANLPALLIYPFQTFNVFEFLYWLLLAGGIKDALNTDINQGIKVVFSGYIPALVLWIICVMFITVSLGLAT